MAIRNPRLAVLGALLAMIALFGIVGVSGWHNAVIHSHDHVHAAAADQTPVPAKQTDTEAPIHLLAHAIAQWVAPTGSIPAPLRTFIVNRVWLLLAVVPEAGIDPYPLLRPPRG